MIYSLGDMCTRNQENVGRKGKIADLKQKRQLMATFFALNHKTKLNLNTKLLIHN